MYFNQEEEKIESEEGKEEETREGAWEKGKKISYTRILLCPSISLSAIY